MSSAQPGDLEARVGEWRDWLGTRTDALLELEDRIRVGGDDVDQVTLSEAFVLRRAIVARLDAMSARARRDPAGAAALAGAPLHDDLDTVVGDDLRSAAARLDELLGEVERSLGERVAVHLAAASLRTRAVDDLGCCSRLADVLGRDDGALAELADRLASGADLEAVAAELAERRRRLEEADGVRREQLEEWAGLAERLDGLARLEIEAQALARRCRSEVSPAPVLAVPSVEAVRAEYDAAISDDPAGRPWPEAGERIAPLLRRVRRVEAALAEARRRFAGPLRRRDELRGLFGAFGAKAAAFGVAASGEVEALRGGAATALDRVPCDVDLASELVACYVAAVNVAIERSVAS